MAAMYEAGTQPFTAKMAAGKHGATNATMGKNSVLQLTNTVTWMPNGTLRVVADVPRGTSFLTVGCSAPYDAVRLGLPRLTGAGFGFKPIVASNPSSWGDFVNPEPSAARVKLPIAHETPSSISISKRLVGDNWQLGHQPDWAWTDWAPLDGSKLDAETGMAIVMLRGFFQGGSDMVAANGMLQHYSDDVRINKGFKVFMGGVKDGWDLTGFEYVKPELLPRNNPVNGTPFVCVQFQTKSPGIVGMVVGDSHQSGTGTTGQVNSFLFQTISKLRSNHFGRMPFSLVNAAFGGARSDQYFPRGEALLSDVKPSFVVLPSWSFNDHSQHPYDPEEIDQALFNRLERAIKCVEENGALPVLLTPFPRNAQVMTKALVTSWLAQRERILNMGVTTCPPRYRRYGPSWPTSR